MQRLHVNLSAAVSGVRSQESAAKPKGLYSNGAGATVSLSDPAEASGTRAWEGRRAWRKRAAQHLLEQAAAAVEALGPLVVGQLLEDVHIHLCPQQQRVNSIRFSASAASAVGDTNLRPYARAALIIAYSGELTWQARL